MYDVYHKMRKHGWVVANDGNVSVRLPEGNFMATSTGISKNFILQEKLVIINDNGEVFFEKFHDCWSEYMSLAEAAIFEYAFKLGMQIAIETLTE